MSAPFSRSLRALQTDGNRQWLLPFALGLLLITLWSAWFWGTKLKVYAMTPQATLQIQRAIYPLATERVGKLVSHTLRLGRKIKKGELLLQLDATELSLQLKQEQARLETAIAKKKAIELQKQADKKGHIRSRQVNYVAMKEMRLQRQQAKRDAKRQKSDRARLARLSKKGLISRIQYRDAKAKYESSRDKVQQLTLQLRQLSLRRQQQRNLHDTQQATYLKELATLTGEIKIRQAACQRLEIERKKYSIRAPRDGYIGNVTELALGSMLPEGTKVGTLIAQGEVKIIADFPPAAALGRITKGQRASMRLTGFSWVQYGSLSGRVDSVASVPQKGLIRVELSVLQAPSSPIPLKHGMPGSVEILIERMTPAALFLRSAGQLLAPSARQHTP